jgi:hypothetical protein
MKQQDMIVMGLAAVAVVLIFKATKKPATTLSTAAAKISNEPFRSPGDGSTGNWKNDFGYQRDKEYMALIGL